MKKIDRDIQLVRDAIAVWKANEKKARARKGRCPLCAVYHNIDNVPFDETKACNGCPVKMMTGERHCRATPFYDDDSRWRAHCGKMIAFGEEVLTYLLKKKAIS